MVISVALNNTDCLYRQQNGDNCQMKIIVSGGGTGGHIYPALTIADTIKTVSGRGNTFCWHDPRIGKGSGAPCGLSH